MSRTLDTLEGDMTNFVNIVSIGQDNLQRLHLEAQHHVNLEPIRVQRRQQVRTALKTLRFAVRQLLALEPNTSWRLA
jgi:hypothetical protein